MSPWNQLHKMLKSVQRSLQKLSFVPKCLRDLQFIAFQSTPYLLILAPFTSLFIRGFCSVSVAHMHVCHGIIKSLCSEFPKIMALKLSIIIMLPLRCICIILASYSIPTWKHSYIIPRF